MAGPERFAKRQILLAPRPRPYMHRGRRSYMALSDVALRCEAMSGLGATADIGRRYGLDRSVAFDPEPTSVDPNGL